MLGFRFSSQKKDRNMKTSTTAFTSGILGAALACIVLFSANIAKADDFMPENYLKRWDDPAVQKRIDDGIEKHRKGNAVVKIVDAQGRPVDGAKVELSQASHEFLFGCNCFVVGQMKEQNQAYEEAFAKIHNFATLPFYWAGTEPEKGTLRFKEGSSYMWRRPPTDRCLEFCKKYNITPKGHPLLWHNGDHNPKWLPKDPEKLKKTYTKRFKELADRYADSILLWDCVNESMICWKDYPFFSEENPAHPPYVAWGFNEAEKIFPAKTTLMINEITAANWSWPSDANPGEGNNRYYDQCEKLLDDGVNIEGIGFQFHFFSRKSLDNYMKGDRCDPNAMLDTYEKFAKFGLPLWSTEITIGSAGENGLKIQERVVRDIYRLWFSTPNMAGITWWNLSDGAAHGNEGKAGGGLLDEQMNPKPAYKALDQLINHAWRTNLTATSDASGNVKFRGFYGKYKVKVTDGDKTKEFEIDLGKGKEDSFTLKM